MIALALLGFAAGSARAGTIIPTTTLDVSSTPTDKGNCSYSNPPSGTCSLRQALVFASSGDTISLQAAAPSGPYTLSKQLEFDVPVTVMGAGAAATTIVQTNADRVLLVAPSANGVTISGLTITGGHVIGTAGAPGTAGTAGTSGSSPTDGGDGSDAAKFSGGKAFGGGIYNQGTLTLDGVVVTGNSATGGAGGAGGGGGAGGSLTAGSRANAGRGGNGGGGGNGGTAYGGGIYSNGNYPNPPATLTLHNVTLSDNLARGGAGGAGGRGGRGGSVRLGASGAAGAGGDAGPANVTDSFIEHEGFARGGGLESFGTATLDGVTASGNSAVGGVGGTGGAAGGGGSPGGTSGTSSSGGNGGGTTAGGIEKTGNGDQKTLSVANTTISANTAAGGAGGAGSGASSAGATGSGYGGGITAPGGTRLGNVTIASNTATGSPARGGDLLASGPLHLTDTVIAAGSGDPGVGDCYAYTASDLVSDGFNLSDDPAAGNCHLTAFGDQPATNPMLGPLQDNGGPTQTMALGAGSSAIDAGNPSGCIDPATSLALTIDQRAITRPKGSACDIGAFERALPTALTGNPSAIAQTTAHLAGTVNPEQLPTTYRFEYGKTNAYGSLTTPVSAGAGGVNVPAGTNLSGLQPNTTYHYRLIATNGDGAAIGSDRNFKTRPPPFLGASIRTTSAKLDPLGRAPVKLSCPANTIGKCAGKLTLTASVPAPNHTHKRVTIGSAKFSIPAGARATIKVKLSATALGLIKKNKKLAAKATAAARDNLARSKRTTATLTLKPAG